jgi:hypothetical protein
LLTGEEEVGELADDGGAEWIGAGFGFGLAFAFAFAGLAEAVAVTIGAGSGAKELTSPWPRRLARFGTVTTEKPWRALSAVAPGAGYMAKENPAAVTASSRVRAGPCHLTFLSSAFAGVGSTCAGRLCLPELCLPGADVLSILAYTCPKK